MHVLTQIDEPFAMGKVRLSYLYKLLLLFFNMINNRLSLIHQYYAKSFLIAIFPDQEEIMPKFKSFQLVLLQFQVQLYLLDVLIQLKSKLIVVHQSLLTYSSYPAFLRIRQKLRQSHQKKCYPSVWESQFMFQFQPVVMHWQKQ